MADYSEEGVIRIQNAFDKDRPASYGDEGGDRTEELKGLEHLTPEEKQKIKMKSAAAGVVTSLALKGGGSVRAFVK